MFYWYYYYPEDINNATIDTETDVSGYTKLSRRETTITLVKIIDVTYFRMSQERLVILLNIVSVDEAKEQPTGGNPSVPLKYQNSLTKSKMLIGEIKNCRAAFSEKSMLFRYLTVRC